VVNTVPASAAQANTVPGSAAPALEAQALVGAAALWDSVDGADAVAVGAEPDVGTSAPPFCSW
jgi:hypothetical protein